MDIEYFENRKNTIYKQIPNLIKQSEQYKKDKL